MHREILIVEQPIDLEPYVRKLTFPNCGAVTTFLGVVRDHAAGKNVVAIEYTAYDAMARKELERVVDRVGQKHGVEGVVVVHRLGRLLVGEASLGVVTASGHRKEALMCTLEIIDEMKKTVPIWKREFGPDGASWV